MSPSSIPAATPAPVGSVAAAGPGATVDLAGPPPDRWRSVYHGRGVLLGLIALGVLLRAVQYLSNRSLWVDEAYLALNIVGRSAWELIGPLDFNQAAPPGFLLLERLSVVVLGNHEWVLRLVPFLSGVGALVLFALLARRLLDRDAVPPALFLFALSPWPIYYASEVKQYSSDALIAIVLVLLALPAAAGTRTVRQVAALALAGAAAVWLAYPAVFVLAGIGATVLAGDFRQRDWRGAARFAVAPVAWLASLALLHVVQLRHLTESDFLREFWAHAFMRLPPTSVGDLEWLPNATLRLMADPVGFTLPGVAVLLALAGAIALREQGAALSMLVAPLGFAALASGLERYPFASRVMLFAVPALLLLVAQGLAWVVRRAWPVSRLGAVAVPLLFLYQPVLNTLARLPSEREEVPAVLRHLGEEIRPDDRLYVYHRGWQTFLYYAPEFGLADREHVVGIASRDDWSGYRTDVAALAGAPRAWFLFSHVDRGHGVDEERLVLVFLDELGVRRAEYHATGASLYLYDLSVGRDRSERR